MIGALVSMLTMASIGRPITVTPVQLIAMLVMSALIGIVSAIFDIEQLPFYVALSIHFVVVGGLVFGTSFLLKGLFGTPQSLLLLYIVIYIGVWLLLKFWWLLDAQRINRRIRRRNRLK